MKKWERVVDVLGKRAEERRTTLRWRRNDSDSVRLGEAQAMLDMLGYKVHANSKEVKALSSVMKLVGENPDLFHYHVDDKKYPTNATASLGKMLYLRVGHLTEADTKAQNFMRTWMTADLDLFSEFHLPKMLGYFKSRHTNDKVSVEDLLAILYQWDFDNSANVSAISTEYFSEQYRNQKGNDQ